MHDDIASKLITLLDKEREILRSGKLTELSQIIDAKTELEQALSECQPRREQLEIIRAKAANNADLLAASIRGVKSARDRLAALSSVQDVLSVYGPKGELKHMPTGRGEVEQKA